MSDEKLTFSASEIGTSVRDDYYMIHSFEMFNGLREKLKLLMTKYDGGRWVTAYVKIVAFKKTRSSTPSFSFVTDRNLITLRIHSVTDIDYKELVENLGLVEDSNDGVKWVAGITKLSVFEK